MVQNNQRAFLIIFFSVNLLLNSKIVYFLKFSDQPQEIIEIRAKFTICSKLYL